MKPISRPNSRKDIPMRWLLALVLLAGIARADEPTPVGAVFQDCSNCPEMVVLPAGDVTMGATAEDLALIHLPEDAAREQPRHKATLHTFAISRSAVTRAQFSAFVFETGYQVTGGCNTFDMPSGEYDMHPLITWLEPGFVQGDRDPVVCISYQDAVAYLRWLTATTKRPYRLPSEAEWEYAARAGTTGLRFWGAEDACRYANVADRAAVAAGIADTHETAFSCNDGHVTPTPIASFAPNRFGLFDMLGNVAQWAADCSAPSYVGAPTDGSARPGPKDCEHVIRGGGWMDGPATVRAARRASAPVTYRTNGLGLRLARDLEPPADAQ
jgi:formylglycine-generating enzyme required for sulfatase activity